MRVTVENLGVIRSASLDLAPGIVVVNGPNGSGKTWLASVLAGLGWPHRTGYVPDGLRIRAEPGLLARYRDILRDTGSVVVAPGELDELVRFALRCRAEGLVRDSLSSFGAACPDGHVAVETSARRPVDGARLWMGNLVLLAKHGAWSCTLAQSEQPSSDGDRARRDSELEFALELLIEVSLPRVFCLPMERSAFPLFVGTLSEGLSRLSRSQLVTHSGWKTFIDGMMGVGAFEPWWASRSLMGGHLQLGPGGMLTFVPEGDAPATLLAYAPGRTRSLSLLALLEARTLSIGDVLLIDEPESGLHPRLQRRLVRELAAWSNRAQACVVLFTHSDVIWTEVHLLSLLARSPEPPPPMADGSSISPESLLAEGAARYFDLAGGVLEQRPQPKDLILNRAMLESATDHHTAWSRLDSE